MVELLVVEVMVEFMVLELLVVESSAMILQRLLNRKRGPVTSI